MSDVMRRVFMSTAIKIITFIALTCVIDLILTVHFRHDQYFYEINPLLRPLLEQDQIFRLSVYKILLDLIGCVCIFKGLQEETKLIRALVWYIVVPVHAFLLCNWTFFLIARGVISGELW